MIGAHEAVARVDSGALDYGEDVALHALAAHVGAVATLAAGDLVDLIEKDDAAGLHALERDPYHLVHIDELLLLFLHQVIKRLGNTQLALPGTLAEEIGQQVLEVDVHLLDSRVGRDLERRPALFHVDFDYALVELARLQTLAQLFPRAV